MGIAGLRLCPGRESRAARLGRRARRRGPGKGAVARLRNPAKGDTGPPSIGAGWSRWVGRAVRPAGQRRRTRVRPPPRRGSPRQSPKRISLPGFPGNRGDTGIPFAQNGSMDPTTAWVFVVVFWLAPIVHVATSPRSGPVRPPAGARCPFGPRIGWLVIVVLLGAVGWLLFMSARYRRRVARDGGRGRGVGREEPSRRR